ncbi:MAG: sigma-70 family RNA polymerase sigma factor [Rhizobiaceae bacterium]|nr:sigma-70 family RNA polymerase sigma factor [Rhizobiaceae bacterium]
MNDAAPRAIAVTKAIEAAVQHDRGRLLAGLIARLKDFQAAEDALQEAMISALGHWARFGIPASPAAWLMRAALNKGIDRLRASARDTRKVQNYRQIAPTDVGCDDPEDIPDQRLRLIFTCCHPALEEKSRVALTLRTVCNLTTREIAAAFLDDEATMGQRISRAKTKIKAKGIGFAVPEPEQWTERLSTVLSTIYLIFTTGYVSEDNGPRDLCLEALFLARLLDRLRPDAPEIEGALALMLLTEARRPARIGADGATVPVEDQERALWANGLIVEGLEILARAVARRLPGPFQIKAAIADCHMTEPAPDWPQMSLLYQSLWRHEPTPVVALNWAVVLAELGHADTALEKLDELESDLSEFQPWHAARASMLHKLRRLPDAAKAYHKAIELAPNEPSRLFLEKRLCALESG